MGLEKEIELLFRRVVELDLERISRSAEPSYHWTTTPAPAMFLYQEPGGGSVKLTPRDYQVVRIELNPFGVANADVEVNMGKISDRVLKRKRKLKPDDQTRVDDLYKDFNTQMGPGKRNYDLAYHEYLEVSRAHDPIPILPRHIDVTNPANPKATIISVAGVDYVHTDYLARHAPSPGYQDVIDLVTVNPAANVDQWPEEVVLRRPGGGGQDVYVRADVEYWEEESPNSGMFVRRDHRFVP